jgi:hypothetical protein
MTSRCKTHKRAFNLSALCVLIPPVLLVCLQPIEAYASTPRLCEKTFLRATLDPSFKTIKGQVQCAPTEQPPDHLVFYPPVLSQPTGLDDINRQWLYPRGFEAAQMRWRKESSHNWTYATKPWLKFPNHPPFSVLFQTDIPQRQGTFGRIGDTLYLLGGWHPVWGSPPLLPKTHWHYTIEVPANRVGFVGQQAITRSTQAQVLRGEFYGRFVPIFITPSAHVEVHHGRVLIVPATPWRQIGHRRLQDVMAHRQDLALEELKDTLNTGDKIARQAGLPHPFAIILRGPLRESMIEMFDGGWMISDRAFQLLNIERFLKLHRLRVWRAQLTSGATDWMQKPPPMPLISERCAQDDLLGDFLAIALRNSFAHKRYGAMESAVDMLSGINVIPEIDALIHAPQTVFSDTYYEAIDESPAHRRRLDNFHNTCPQGKLLYAKVLDRYGLEEVRKRTQRWLAGESWEQSFADPIDALWIPSILKTWLGPLPKIDYRLEKVTWTNKQTTVQIGSTASREPTSGEVISVELSDHEGVTHRRQRRGLGQVSFPVGGAPKQVIVDPDHRLVETTTQTNQSARYNNRLRPRWRFLLNNVTGLFAVTRNHISAAIDFSLRRDDDLTHRTYFSASYHIDGVGIGMSQSYRFGRPLTPLSLSQSLNLALRYEYLLQEGKVPVGHELSLRLSHHYDSRLSPYWGYEGSALRSSAEGAYALDELGLSTYALRMGVGGLHIQPLGFGQALVGRLSGDLQLGDAPQASAFSLGGRYRGARGYEPDEAKSSKRVIASLEYRQLLIPDGHTDFWGLITFTRMEAALFADALYFPVERPGCQRDTFFDVGVGLRVMGDILSIKPSTLQIDIGIPLNRCVDETYRPPVSIYLSLHQSFSAF